MNFLLPEVSNFSDPASASIGPEACGNCLNFEQPKHIAHKLPLKTIRVLKLLA